MLKKLAFALALLPFAAHASNLPEYPFIHVAGEGYLRLMPDMGEIDFDISAYDADTNAAVAVVQARVAEIQALLAEQGGDAGAETEAEASFADMRKEMRKPANPDPNAAPDYEIRSAVHIVVRDLTKWRAVMLGLLGKPNIDHMSTSFGKSDRLKVEAELTATAIKDAQRRAENLATGLGKKVGAVTAITNGQLRNLTNAVGLLPTDMYNNRRGSNAKAGEKDFLTIQSLQWSQTVDVIYRIK
ncbi:SIMPL domain-containing protein [Rugamonas aquatica]|uniref:DUF541 domain-containing protein n=1 Tax=Rugamonas aquatica TaxID=2743357 RepID=A0A6A7N1A5_9BURK|nr:SIMPL domain-containing protein [Rugamonas aquatica]MQA38819.1 DUF541 domain-containing protein [Rugamonas aquatica]